MSPLDDLLLSKYNCMAYGVLQLADIARPIIVHQGLHGIGGEQTYIFPLFQIVFFKEMFAKQRFFSPVLVRGEEQEGIKVWGYGKMAYEKLLTIVLDPDYGDITDPETGNDLKLMYGKLPGASYPRTDIRPRPRKTVLCDDAVGGDDRCAELLETIPNFDEIFERKTTEEVQSILDQFMATGAGNPEVEKFGSTTGEEDVDNVSAAFSDLLGQ